MFRKYQYYLNILLFFSITFNANTQPKNTRASQTAKNLTSTTSSFIKWSESSTRNLNLINNLLEKNKKDLWEINKLYKNKMGISLFNDIFIAFNNNWFPDKKIADFLNLWVKELTKNNLASLQNRYTYPPTVDAFLWNIRTNNRKAIKNLPKMLSPYMEKIKKQYLTMNSTSFHQWIKNKTVNNSNKNKEANLELLEAVGIANKNYQEVINANIMLADNLEKSLGTIQDKMNYIANIARYSVILDKVSSNARNCIINYQTLLNKYPSVKKDFDKDIKQQCINDVIKKYDLLNGKPKDGYYYPVNDMKIKTQADD